MKAGDECSLLGHDGWHTVCIFDGEVIFMNSSNSKRGTIWGAGLMAAAGFVLMLGADANAQTMQQERRQDRQENRQDRREDRRDSRQDGYQAGLQEGAEDARARRRSNPQGEVDYRRAGGANNARERQAYRTGFIQGYNEGYRNNRRGGRRGN
jgi:hypothetical protein